MAFILDGNAPATPAAAAGKGDWVKDTDTDNFVQDVIEASMQTPIVVDFWAPWCGPCKTLGPMLEKLVQQCAGKVRMVKVNIDDNPQIASQLQIRSVPTVYAFKGGRPVDGFAGALPESQLKSFLDGLVGGGANILDDALAQAKEFLDNGDVDTATQIYQEILGQDPAHAGAIAGMLNCYLARGMDEQARSVLEKLPEALLKTPEIQTVKTRLDLLAQASEGDELSTLEASVAAAPEDHQRRFDLAMAYFAADRREEACEALLDIIRADRTWNEEQARKQLVKFFEVFGLMDPVSKAMRRKLSALWLS